jgi:hypothetical protein
MDLELAKFLKSKPYYLDEHELLEKKLNEDYPNTLVVPMPSTDIKKYKHIIEKKSFKVMDNKNVVLIKMIEGRCHDNVEILTMMGKIEKIGFGYVLNDNDCRWREHSWGIKDGKIIETTIVRKVYVQLNV